MALFVILCSNWQATDLLSFLGTVYPTIMFYMLKYTDYVTSPFS